MNGQEMTDSELAESHGETLCRVAADALRYGLEHNAAPILAASNFAAPLRAPRASFVTLEENEELRGCIGSVAARRALVEDVAENAYGAGFRDPRFAPLTQKTLGRLSVGISILGPFETISCADENDLFRQARPGLDGFVITAAGHRGLFLPQVWETLPTPRLFFDMLREKAGLPRRYWSTQLHIERFKVTSIPKRSVNDLAAV
ncbi:MAG: AmmeMemoRadiSam system protein A [Rhodospirillaceae bacterium]